MDILKKIVRAKRLEVEQEMRRLPMRRAIELASAAAPTQDFAGKLTASDGVKIIAEVKRASPSRGEIRKDADPVAIARVYADAGAAAISVLTDARFFLGSPDHLRKVREAVPVPLLRKDFIVDEYQIYRSRALGADAILLIARLLTAMELRTFTGVAHSLHMEALLEISSEEELEKAAASEARLVGVNNRDLTTMSVSVETSLRLAPLLPASVIKVSESGIETRADIERLRAVGFDAFLVGERLMREPDPGVLLREWTGKEAS